MKTNEQPFGSWASVGAYAVQVTAVKEATVYDTGQLEATHVRAIRILVAYANHTQGRLNCRLNQWHLLDTEGFAYEFELRNQFYEDDALRKLQSGVIEPGQETQGWVAFQAPADASLASVQFRPDYLSDEVATFQLPPTGKGKLDTAVSKSSREKQSWRSWGQQFLRRQKAQASTSTPKLQEGQQYRLVKPVTDFFGRAYIPDSLFTFRAYLPIYEGLHILEFTEATVYLHADQHADILANWGRYFEPFGVTST